MNIIKQTFNRKIFLVAILSCFTGSIMAQGDGGRMLLWGPKGVTAFIPKWMNLSQNIVPGNILIKQADVSINVFPMTLVHNFGLAGRFAQIMVMANPGTVNGTVDISQPGIPEPTLSNSGWADGFIGFKFGLINTPALNVIEFAGYKQKFSMFSYFRLWYPGSYSQKNPLNLGTNRITFEFGFPMNLHIGNNLKRPTILEMYPALHIFGVNSDPTAVSMANETHQQPLFSFENHLTHNLTDKFWAGVDLRYQVGGALDLDDEKQDNAFNTLGAGVVMGYQALPMLAVHAAYGGRIAGSDGAKYQMLKMTAVLSYVNMKKVKADAAKKAEVK